MSALPAVRRKKKRQLALITASRPFSLEGTRKFSKGSAVGCPHAEREGVLGRTERGKLHSRRQREEHGKSWKGSVPFLLARRASSGGWSLKGRGAGFISFYLARKDTYGGGGIPPPCVQGGKLSSRPEEKTNFVAIMCSRRSESSGGGTRRFYDHP